MKKYTLIYATILAVAVSFTACEDWVTEQTPGTTKLEDFFTSGETAIAITNGAYVPLQWEYNKTFYSEWFIGDVVSDDALKGGQTIDDMAAVYDMENFKTISNNDFLLDFYRGQYQGIGRCNLALQEVSKMSPDDIMTAKIQNRLIGELKFLRALYYFRLVRVFGDIPLVTEPVLSSADWKQKYVPAADVYSQIISDLEDANKTLWKKSEYAATDLGRATKGAAQAMLLKANLYTHNYPEAKKWGDSIIASNEYRLIDDYADNFTLAGENGAESVFEIQYTVDATSDWGDGAAGGNGFTRGTFTTIEVRSRSSSLGGGYGFNKPTQNLYDEFETGDPRRDASILNPTDNQIENPNEEIYLGSRYLNRKYGMYDAAGKAIALTHDSRGPLNNKVIRYADVLLMYAEACVETNDLAAAKNALEQVRARARGTESILPVFPYSSYADNQDDLRKAIRHERRVELAMEGHRWFDLCRWGVAKEVMNAYRASETDEVRTHMNEFVDGNELFPIPSKEIDLNPR
ncbi:membrane protein [Bacteroidia bacterium]|nr:membrane protein [Bacteroidia bacterium]